MVPETSELLSALHRLEAEMHPRRIAADGEPWFNCLHGEVPVLVSAPHACRHMRQGKEKMSEEYTAALAIHVAAVTGCHALYTTHKSSEDPNFVNGGEYKNQVARLVAQHNIQLLIDLHGMTNRHHMGVALGTIHQRTCCHQRVAGPFEQHGFARVNARDVLPPLEFTEGVPLPHGAGAEQHSNTVALDHPLFTGGVRNHTVTRFAAEQLGIAAVQVEIASVNRIVHRQSVADWPHEYRGNADGIAATVNALIALVNNR